MNRPHVASPKSLGFTLFELLITLGISSFILMATLSILTDFIRVRNQSSFRNRLLSTSELVFSALTEDIHNSTSAELDTFETLILTLNSGEVVTYQRDPSTNQLLRNGRSMAPDSIQVNSFLLTNVAPTDALPLIRIHLELANAETKAITADLSKTTTISLRTYRGN